MIQDSVVAIVPEELMAEVLPAVHRAGLGHLARVLRAGRRGPIADQLQRAGVPATQAPERVTSSATVLLVTAAARSPMAGLLLMQRGASQAWIVSSLGTWTELEDLVIQAPSLHVLPPHPAQRIPGRDPHQTVRRSAIASSEEDQASPPVYLPESPAMQDGGSTG